MPLAILCLPFTLDNIIFVPHQWGGLDARSKSFQSVSYPRDPQSDITSNTRSAFDRVLLGLVLRASEGGIF